MQALRWLPIAVEFRTKKQRMIQLTKHSQRRPYITVSMSSFQ